MKGKLSVLIKNKENDIEIKKFIFKIKSFAKNTNIEENEKLSSVDDTFAGKSLDDSSESFDNTFLCKNSTADSNDKIHSDKASEEAYENICSNGGVSEGCENKYSYNNENSCGDGVHETYEEIYSYSDRNNAYFDETTFYYNDYKVIIQSNSPIYFSTIQTNCPFLYADELNINLTEFKESYELQFKAESYYNEPLLLSTADKYYISLDICTKYLKKVVCKIDKEKILGQYNKNQVFKVYYINELLGFQEFDFLPEVEITSSLKNKETIFVHISNLEYAKYDLNNHIAFRTNVTNIGNVVTDYFILDSDRAINCFLKKVLNDPLFVLCKWPSNGTFILGEIKNKIILDNISIIYNFILLPVSNSEIFSIGPSGSLPLFVYPQILDFYLNDSISIFIRMQFPENTN